MWSKQGLLPKRVVLFPTFTLLPWQIWQSCSLRMSQFSFLIWQTNPSPKWNKPQTSKLNRLILRTGSCQIWQGEETDQDCSLLPIHPLTPISHAKHNIKPHPLSQPHSRAAAHKGGCLQKGRSSHPSLCPGTALRRSRYQAAAIRGWVGSELLLEEPKSLPWFSPQQWERSCWQTKDMEAGSKARAIPHDDSLQQRQADWV